MQFVWSASTLKLADECPYKYKLVMLDGWQSPKLSAHLIFGAAYATALEHYAKYFATGLGREESLRRIIKEALIETWLYEKDEAGNDIPNTGEPWISDHNLKTRENLIRSIIWYFEQFADDAATVVILPDGSPAVEYKGAIAVDDGIMFAFHLDKLVDYVGSLMVMDQKTTGTTISARYFDGYKPDIQMSMYTFVGKAVFQMPVKGVIIDAAQIAVGFSRFERGMTYRSESELNEFYDQTMRNIELTRAMTRENYFPMRTSSCGNYGGCPFRTACSRSPEVRTQFLKADFIQGAIRDPLGA